MRISIASPPVPPAVTGLMTVTVLVTAMSVVPSSRSGAPADEVGAANVAAFSLPAPTATVTCGLGSFDVGQWPTDCWRPYADSSPFNRPLDASPRVVPNSVAIIDRLLSMGPIAAPVAGVADTAFDWYHPLYYSRPTDPVYTVHCTEAWGRCELEGMQIRIPGQARAAGGSDGHLGVIDQVTGWEYDFWQVHSKPADGGVLTTSWGGRTSITGDGLGSGATASNFGLAAGVIRAAELEAGHIDHALSILVGCTSDTFVYPAEKTAHVCADPTNAPATGQHLWLDMTPATINDLPVPEWKKTVLRALSVYGAYIGDTGGNVSIGFQIESGSSFTSFGVADPMVDFARRQPDGVFHDNGTWTFDMASDVDWAGRLRVVDPCVAAGKCAACGTRRVPIG